ncbi:hypothetical protein BMS3Bbin03_02183 [bacterium BMS3Bbin03]|nr:hypothetical protein BMS3Bbin03_02183 [bacterium BMS3Bbin03]
MNKFDLEKRLIEISVILRIIVNQMAYFINIIEITYRP